MMKALQPEKYSLLLPLLKAVKINHLFVKSVLKDYVDGRVYVDNDDLPTCAYVVHPYGMALLFGNPDNTDFCEALGTYFGKRLYLRPSIEWLQVYPEDWHSVLPSLLAGEIKTQSRDVSGIPADGPTQFSRVNFEFIENRFSEFYRVLPASGFDIVNTSASHFESMEGRVIPKYFYRSSDQFAKTGIGFSAIDGEIVISTAYAVFIHDRQLEIGIETIPSYRGRGLASQTCAALIRYCLENDYEPVWSCLLENTGSFNLARKLGFMPTLTFPIYKLP